jgi:hypothetical protein
MQASKTRRGFRTKNPVSSSASAFGVLAFEFSGTNFDQAFMAASQKSGRAKLTRENETRAARIVGQNRGAIAWVVYLAGKALHAPIETLSFDGDS